VQSAGGMVIVVIFMVLQRFFVKGLAGAVKG
jgi:ABC-type maltose transport system permease subunit